MPHGGKPLIHQSGADLIRYIIRGYNCLTPPLIARLWSCPLCRPFAEIELLGAWKGKTRKKLAIGVVSHRTLNAETPEEVAKDIRKALKYVNVENLLVTSDCGFGRQGTNRLGIDIARQLMILDPPQPSC
jgi:hypothetical protein